MNLKSQSPLTGQFNFYKGKNNAKQDERYSKSQSPLTGQFNFYIRKNEAPK